MRPLARYFEQFSACSPQTVTRCHSVRSWRWPPLSLKTSLVAMLRLHTGRLLGVYLSSGSAPRFPTRITLFTLPIVRLPPCGPHHAKSALKKRPSISRPLEVSGGRAASFRDSIARLYWTPDGGHDLPPMPLHCDGCCAGLGPRARASRVPRR